MRYYGYQIGDVDAIKDTNISNRIWNSVSKNGVRLSGCEVLIYLITLQGELWVFVNPDTSVSDAILNTFAGKGHKVTAEYTRENFREIEIPGYYEVLINEYQAMVRCTDDLTADQINSLSCEKCKNDYAALRNGTVEIPYDRIVKVEDMPAGELKDNCLKYIERAGWPLHQSYLIKKSNEDMYMCIIPVKCRLEEGDV